MKALREIDADSLTPYILTIGLILLISAPILPVAVIMFIQDMLFFSYDHLSFIRPQAAYSGFAAGMALVAVTLFSFLFTKLYAEKKRRDYRLAGLHLFLLLLALPLFALSIFHYAYLNEDGVHVNPFWSLTEVYVAWDQVEHVVRTVDEGTSRVLSYTFIDGDVTVTVPYDSQDFQTVRTINRASLQYDWETTDTFENTGQSLNLFTE